MKDHRKRNIRLMEGMGTVLALALAAFISYPDLQSGGPWTTKEIVVRAAIFLAGLLGLIDIVLSIIDHYRNPDTEIVEKLDNIRDTVDKLTTPVAPTITPRIAPPVADFTGRDQELETLQAQIESGVAICGFKAMGGIGKTELARELAQRLADDYPDGGMTVELRGTEDPSADPARALESILRRLTGENVDPSTPLMALVEAYQGAMLGKKMIVLLDDARDAAQVEPLLPPPPSLAIVTSRNRIVLPKLKMITLETLSEADAIALLLEICDRIGNHAQAIAQACGCLPLALRLAGGALAGDETLTVERYLAKLGQQDGTLGFAEQALAASYDLLAEDLKPLWCQLAVFPADFDVQGAAAVWRRQSNFRAAVGRVLGIGPGKSIGMMRRLSLRAQGVPLGGEQTRAALSELHRQSLIQYDIASSRYSLHDLARVYAADRACCADAAALEPARLRHARHYRRILWQANGLYLAGNEGIAQGLALFDAEWLNIQAGQAWAAAHMVDGQAVLELVNVYCGQISILSLRQHARERISWLGVAAAAARALDDKRVEGMHLGNMGVAYASLGEVQRSIEFHEQALAIAREIGDRRSEGKDLGNLGLAYADLGQVLQAIHYYMQQLAIALGIDDLESLMHALTNLGNAYLRLGDVRRAIEHHEQALAIARTMGNRRSEGSDLDNLGIDYLHMGDVQRAIDCHEQALAIAREMGNRRGENHALGNLGVAYANLGQMQRAIDYFSQHLEIAREIGDLRGEGNDLDNLGNAYSRLGDVRQAIDYHEQALAIAREIGDRRGEGNALGNLGIAYKDLGQVDKAIGFYEQSLVIAREIGDRSGEANGHFNMGLLLRQQGQPDTSREHSQVALALYEAIESPGAEKARRLLAALDAGD